MIKAFKSFLCRGIYVHVLEIWGEVNPKVDLALLVVLFNKLFVVHGQLLLVLLQADVDAVDKHLAVDNSSLRLHLYLGGL